MNNLIAQSNCLANTFSYNIYTDLLPYSSQYAYVHIRSHPWAISTNWVSLSEPHTDDFTATVSTYISPYSPHVLPYISICRFKNGFHSQVFQILAADSLKLQVNQMQQTNLDHYHCYMLWNTIESLRHIASHSFSYVKQTILAHTFASPLLKGPHCIWQWQFRRCLQT